MIHVRWHPKDGEETILAIEEGADPFAVLATVEKTICTEPRDTARDERWDEMKGKENAKKRKLVKQSKDRAHSGNARATQDDGGRGNRENGGASRTKHLEDRQPIRSEARGNHQSIAIAPGPLELDLFGTS